MKLNNKNAAFENGGGSAQTNTFEEATLGGYLITISADVESVDWRLTHDAKYRSVIVMSRRTSWCAARRLNIEPLSYLMIPQNIWLWQQYPKKWMGTYEIDTEWGVCVPKILLFDSCQPSQRSFQRRRRKKHQQLTQADIWQQHNFRFDAPNRVTTIFSNLVDSY